MTYKFVRIDSSEPCKVILQVGKHIIGRGKFLVSNADDNKVSRNHAELEVTADSVTVKSLHINPCFYIKNGTEEIQVLSQDNTITLSNGDRFGILPQIYWYELIHFLEDESHENEQVTHEENRIEEHVQTRKADEQVESNTIKKEDDSINFQLNQTAENGCSQESISLLRNRSPTQEYNLDSPVAEPIIDTGDISKTPVKRPHSSEESDQNDASKKVKTESESSDTTKAGPSDEQKVSPMKEVKDEPSQSPAQPPPTVQVRERCMYGANCYRKNVQHKAQFSHPQDSDWDENQRHCPFGDDCRRRNPHHWRDYLHPARVNPPNPRPGKRKQKRSTTSESEDSSPSKLIVTGKRIRKTVQREAWSDSGTDAEPDPYGSDDSEEWVPPRDATQTQDYSQEWD